MILFSLITVFIGTSVLAKENIQCRDENNNPVDWYVLYKFPKLKHSSQPFIKEGKGYMFITSSTLGKGWEISTKPIDSNSTILAQTLPFIKDDADNVLWFVYNDQGDAKCLGCGHTKGIVAGDEAGGLWLVHSIPHFIHGVYPVTGLKFGQSALCISLGQAMLNSVGDLLAYNQPQFQRWNIINEFQEVYPKLFKAFHGIKVAAPWTLQTIITSLEGTNFHSFAKAKAFNKDLYEWVASSLETDLLTETWINEMHILPSSCGLRFRVINVESIVIPQLGIQYSSHKDHSKIAISEDEAKPWICIGDINRAEAQEKRGGGTLCLDKPDLWKYFSLLVNTTENCTTFSQSVSYGVKLMENV